MVDVKVDTIDCVKACIYPSWSGPTCNLCPKQCRGDLAKKDMNK